MGRWIKHSWETELDLGDLGSWPCEISGRIEYSSSEEGFAESSEINFIEIQDKGGHWINIPHLIDKEKQQALHTNFEENFEELMRELKSGDCKDYCEERRKGKEGDRRGQ